MLPAEALEIKNWGTAEDPFWSLVLGDCCMIPIGDAYPSIYALLEADSRGAQVLRRHNAIDEREGSDA